MTPQELKSSILQLAIQGKLVEQRLEEGTAEELYQQIQAEKRRLIKVGTVKNQVPSPDILEEDKPFDIPESWMWCRITECGFFVSGYTPKPSHLTNSGSIPYFKVSDMNTKGNELWLSITSNYLKSSNTCKTYPINTIVYPKNGGAVFTNKKRILAQNSVIDLNTGGYYPFEPLSLSYIYLFLSTIDFRFYYKGTALPTLDMGKLATILIPLPALAEQKRIVAKIEELLPYIDRYEQAWSKLENFNQRFPGDMQESILQMAIQGKLVEQRSEEGTGEELYRQIQAEKQKLIKAGKIKKEKPLPEIAEDEKPFDIPESWRWCYVGDLFQHNTGKALNGTTGKGTLLSYITTSNLYWDRFELDKLKEMPFTDTELERVTVTNGDLLVIEGGFYFGRAAVWRFDYDMRIQNHIHRLRPYKEVCIDFFYYLFFLFKQAGWIDYKGIGMQGLSSSAIHKLVFPLPPLAEQKRIVSRLEEILPLCEKLK